MKASVWKVLATAAVATIAASSAFAADMAPRYTKAPPMAAVYNWTGFYIGVNAGYSWGRSNTDAAFYNNATGLLLGTGTAAFDMDGWVAGGQAGYNWQRERWVLGVEGDIQATGQKGSVLFNCPGVICSTNTAIPVANAPVNVRLENKLDWFATFRGRAGYTFTPTVLGYVTGGLAVGGVNGNGTITGFTGGGLPIAATFSNDDTQVGWTVGAGLEASLGGNWTGKVEYLYLDLGKFHTTALLLANAPAMRAEFSSRITDHIARVGVNYRFGGPVVAKY